MLHMYPEQTPDKLGAYANDLLEMILAKYCFLERYMPEFSYVGYRTGALLIKDDRINEVVEIAVKDGRLWCSKDNSHRCNHVIFSIALSEISKLDVDKQPYNMTKSLMFSFI